MSIEAARLSVVVDADTKKGEDGLSRMDKLVGGAGKAIGGLALAAGSAGGVIGVFAGKSAIDLENAFAPVGTLLGTNTEQFADMESAMKKFVANSPTSANDVGLAAYTALSAGITGTENVTAALTASQQLASAGLGDLGGSMGLVTSAINSFKGEGLSAESAAKAFFGTIASGKTTTADLAQGFGEIAPLAAGMGIKFNDLLAATAAMTSSGASASTAYSGIKGALTAVVAPTSEAADAAKQLGLDFSQAHLASVGLPKFLDEVKEATGGNVETMATLFSGVEGLNAVMALTGPQSEAFTANLTNIGTAGDNLSARAAEMENTTSNRFAEMKNKAVVALGGIGQKVIDYLLPKFETAQKWVSDNWPKISKTFGEVVDKIVRFWDSYGRPVFDVIVEVGKETVGWIVDHWPEISRTIGDVMQTVGAAIQSTFGWLMDNKEVLIGIAIALGAVLVSMFVSWAAGAAAAAVATLLAAAPIILITAGIAALAAGVLYCYNHFETFRNVVNTVKDFIVNDLVPAFQAIWSFISDKLIPIITRIIEIAIKPAQVQFDALKSIILDHVIPAFQSIWDFITDKVVPIFTSIATKVGEVAGTVSEKIDAIVGFVTGIPDRIFDTIDGLWNGFMDGITGAKDWVSEKIDEVVGFAKALPGRMVGIFSGMWDGIKDAFKSTLNTIIGWWNGIEFKMPSQHVWGIGDIGGWTIGLPDIPKFHGGGDVAASGVHGEVLAMLQNGETVFSGADSRRLATALGDRRGGGNVYAPTLQFTVIAQPGFEELTGEVISRKIIEHERDNGRVFARANDRIVA